MKRWLSLLLLISAMLGLIGQETAFASVGPRDQGAQTIAASQMTADCAEMMGLAKQPVQSDEPCQGMTPDCIAKMGCTAVAMVAVPQPTVAGRFTHGALPPSRSSIAALAGRETGPEPHPPSRLG